MGSRDKRVPSPIEEVSEEINDSSNPLSQLWSEVQISDWVARKGNVANRYERIQRWGAYINHTLRIGEKCADQAMEESYIRDYASSLYDVIEGFPNEYYGARDSLTSYLGGWRGSYSANAGRLFHSGMFFCLF